MVLAAAAYILTIMLPVQFRLLRQGCLSEAVLYRQWSMYAKFFTVRHGYIFPSSGMVNQKLRILAATLLSSTIDLFRRYRFNSGG